MDDQRKGWNQFQRIKLDRKQLSRRVKKAEKATQRHAHRFVIRRIDNIRLVAREVTIWLVVIGLLIGALGIQLVWSQRSFMTNAPQSGGVYVEGALGAINSLNPLYVTTSAEASAARLIFSSLYNYDSTGAIHQDLATRMNIDETHKVYTVTIRNNAKWHDGTPLTAQDVVFTINLIKNPVVRSPLRINWLDVSASAPDASTVVFTLPAPYTAFPHALMFPILPQHLLKYTSPSVFRESTYSQSPVGSGPFMFRRLQEADAVSKYRVVHMAANNDYYGGEPKLSRFELRAYPDETSLVHAINIGDLSGATDVSVASVKQITQSQAKVTSEALDSGVYLLLNNQNPILKETSVRQALQLATDTEALRKQLGGGVLPLDGPLLRDQLPGVTLPEAPKFNLQSAATLLDSAGWKMVNGVRMKDAQKLELAITTTKDKEFDTVLSAVLNQWQKLGVKVNTNIVDTSKAASTFVQNTLQNRNFDVLLYELAIGADPDVYAYWHSSQIGVSGYNFSNYSNEVTDASLASARSRLEPALRNAKYTQFVKQWLIDVPAIALYQPVIEYVSMGDVNAVQSGTHLVTNADRYANVQYWSVANSTVNRTP